MESLAPQQKPRRISDDPMGKRFNFDTGVEVIVGDHREFDLLKHNDVFFSDNSQEISKEIENNEYNIEDSFEICFESSTHNCNVSDNNSCSECKINMDSVDASGCVNSHSKNDSAGTGIRNKLVQTENEATDDKKKPSKLQRRYVGEFFSCICVTFVKVLSNHILNSLTSQTGSSQYARVFIFRLYHTFIF